MRVVRQWMIKPFKKECSLGRALFLFPLLGILYSCNPTELTGEKARTNVIVNDGSLDGKAYVYDDSPYVLAGPNYGPANVNMSPLLSYQAKLVTTNTSLTGNCSMLFSGYEVGINDCVRSLEKASATDQPLPRKSDRTFIFPTHSKEFYQTNALYHISKGTSTFFDKLTFAYQEVQNLHYSIPKSIPYYLSSSKLFWFKAMSSMDKKLFKTDYLTSYSQCELDKNASFSPAGPTLCFGGIEEIPGFYFVQDPSIIYHELAHALVSVMMNMRNGTNSTTYHAFRSNLGSYGYDEAGSVNEGIADYYSYIMNKRERVGEFALGRTANQARPLSEADDMHIPGVSETSEGRLSYPQFLLYDPNNPESISEDVHYAGQIVTHYFVALTKSLKSECGLTSEDDGGHEKATSYVMLLLAETLSEMGDLNAKGIDNSYGYYFNNLDSTNSYLWTQFNNPVTYRRFFQAFAKNINRYISRSLPFPLGSGLCPSFDKNKSEKLLDDYGLLLFKTYNDNGTSTKDATINFSSTLTAVSENNRRKSVLVSKQLIELAERTDAEPSRVSFYLIDNSTDMENLLKDLLFKGFTVPVTKNTAGTEYNNNNIRVSPGEVVGIIPNLLNNSNSVMAGLQLLATDWDHVALDENTGNFKPCVIDSAITVDQGGESAGTCTTTEKSYNRAIGTKDSFTGKYLTNVVAPVCLVQLEEGDSARWVSQNEFRKKEGLNLLDKDCLGYTTNSSSDQDFTFNPHECLVRFLPGANDAFFSKIEPQKTYYETVVKESESGTFNSGNLMLMEVNKWIPPGTKFRCRLRARFSNCSDCYTDGTNSNDDFIDAEYNGSKPFKVINFDFDVND